MTTLAYAARAPRPDQQQRTHAAEGDLTACGADVGSTVGEGSATEVDCQACRVELHATGELDYLRTPAHRR